MAIVLLPDGYSYKTDYSIDLLHWEVTVKEDKTGRSVTKRVSTEPGELPRFADMITEAYAILTAGGTVGRDPDEPTILL